MKRIILMSTTVAVLMALSGCTDSDGKGSFRKSFVESYVDVDCIDVDAEQTYAGAGGEILVFYMMGKGIANHSSAEYRQLAEYYGDTYFNRVIGVFVNSVVSDEVQSIDVTSSADFNEHPAGESLRDIVNIEYSTAWPFIKSGYTDWGNNGGYHIITKLLSEVTPEDLKLMECWRIYLKFTEIPEIKTHTFTVTVTAIDPFAAEGAKGSSAESLVWSNTADVTFE